MWWWKRKSDVELEVPEPEPIVSRQEEIEEMQALMDRLQERMQLLERMHGLR